MSSLAYIDPNGLATWLRGANAPLWRLIVTPDISLAVNAVAAVLTAAAIGYAFWRAAFSDDPDHKAPAVPFMVAAAFLVVPQFLRHVVSLSPVMMAFLPLAFAWAVLLRPDRVKPGETDDDASRQGGRFRLVLSGALAGVAVWESTLGVAFAPLMLLTTWLPKVARTMKPSKASILWLGGFILTAVLEGFCLRWPFRAFRPVMPPIVGLAVFVVIGIVPMFFVYRFGAKRWLTCLWGALLAASVVWVFRGGFCRMESGYERFAQKVLDDLGNRKLILGDGFTDDFFAVFKPTDVRLLSMRSNADREYMLNFFDGSEPVTNKLLVVRNYYKVPELAGELGLKRRSVETEPKVINSPESRAAALSNEVSRIRRDAEPLMATLKSMEAEIARPAGKRNREVLDRGRPIIRQALVRHAFGGTRLNNVLLMADLLLGDKGAAETDAITALMLNRDDPTANGVLGALRQEEGKLTLAESYLRKGVKGGGAFPMGKLAILLIQTSRPEEALEWARKAVRLNPDDISFLEPLAAALIECGKCEEVEDVLDKIALQARRTHQTERSEAFLAEARKRLQKDQKRAQP